MNINDVMHILKQFEMIIGFPCHGYMNNDPDQIDIFREEYGDDLPNGVKPEDLDYWDESSLIGFRLVKEIWREHPEDEEKEILILEAYIEGGCPYYLQRFRWLGTEQDFKSFTKMYEEASMRCNHLLLILYTMFNKDIKNSIWTRSHRDDKS